MGIRMGFRNKKRKRLYEPLSLLPGREGKNGGLDKCE